MSLLLDKYQHIFRGLPSSPDKTAVKETLSDLAAAVGDDQFVAIAVQELIRGLNPGAIIPSVYHPYRALVHDGLEFFLSRISIDRMIDILADQILLPDTATRGQRLFELAKKCPTLHKLGQIIARNQHIHPDVRKWFVRLENGDYGTPIEKITEIAEQEFYLEKAIFSIQFGGNAISEASVGAVCPCFWKDPESGAVEKAAYKILKPGVRRLLTEDLQVIAALADFFQHHSHRYDLDDFSYVEVFRDIRRTLAEEINLLGEQTHLWDAYQLYNELPDIKIPKLAPFSTRNITVMSHLDGVKVTDADITANEKKACASRLFNTLILKPLFSQSEKTIFHGDPHAGNIMAHKGEKDVRVTLSLVDWSLAGYLKKSVRIKLLQLFQSVLIGNVDGIWRIVSTLGSPWRLKYNGSPRHMKPALLHLMTLKEYVSADLMKKVFLLIDCATRGGMVFPSDLLLFRKSLFTLEGVLYELDPSFSIDEEMTASLRSLVLQEMPKRLGSLLLPVLDTPGRYTSLMSNKDLKQLLLHLMLNQLKNGSVKILAVLHFLKNLGSPIDPSLSCELAV